MYKNFFRLKEKPFSITPDSQLVYPSSKHVQALEHLRYGILEGKGFILITGEAGIGKTTLCRSFLKEMENKIEIALILNSFLSEMELLQAINREFGIPSNGQTREQLITVLNEFLLQKKGEGKTVAVMVDESQNLSVQVLEQLRMLSNLETEKEKLIQIVLIGQPEIEETLNRHELRQLNQRITVRYHIKPLTRAETSHYIRYRLKETSEEKIKVSFSRRAIKKIHAAAAGLPRNINVLCDHLLLAAYVKETFTITPSLVKKAKKELSWNCQTPKNSSFSIPWEKVLAITAALLLIISPFFVAKTFLTKKILTTVEIKSPLQKEEKPLEQKFMSVEETPLPASIPVIAKTEEGYFLKFDDAFWSCAQLWENTPLKNIPLAADKEQTLKQIGFECAQTWAGLSILEKINLPCVLQINFTENENNRFVVLTALSPAQATLLTANQRETQMPRQELEKLWHGKAYIPYYDPEGGEFSKVFIQNMQGEGVELLQKRLFALGYLTTGVSGIYDNDTCQAIEQFQKEMGFPADGVAGTETHLSLLYLNNKKKLPFLFSTSRKRENKFYLSYEENNY